ncbi:hypothetical protein Xen7305DRAFT_00001740 [Xenococcus sp. PCC 7305]|uniref:HepT-like ribonuclease domain-containing protein n=1 Tax=Xenococcus sp. PCC 7305 TaxID=102125 RepID=UPI0002ABD1F0|nr:DUF86 domain-containing protein [Xenococcus sp. PCC 7305]ELS00473.1 hypothetical protein Xen7305DRAFT_00001740 [Xenococcus sp. PCC 7305]
MRSDTERLRDILEAIENIEKYTKQGKQRFEQDELVYTWIVYHLQIIGEASSAMSKTFMENHLEIPWRDMIDFRNILVHEYFQIDSRIIWKVVTEELPNLKKMVLEILKKLHD